MIRKLSSLLLHALFFFPVAALGQNDSVAQGDRGRGFSLELEAGAAWQTRNDVRIPGEGGTRFSLTDVIGEGSFAVGRLTADWDISPRHGLRAVLAPLEFDGTGELKEETQFAGASFNTSVATQGTYNFSNYRLGYRYTFFQDEHWRLRFGGTLFVRDAKIELRQGVRRASDADTGVVPLLNFTAEYAAGDRWRLVADLDGAVAPQGRAVDFALKAYYDFGERSSLGFGYRTIEGGADNDEVFTFAWIHSAVLSLSFRF